MTSTRLPRDATRGLFIAVVVLLLATACGGPDDAGTTIEDVTTPSKAVKSTTVDARRVYDLGRRMALRARAAGDQANDDKTVATLIWTIDEDQRRVLFQHPPKVLRFGPFEGEDCRLRFGVSIKPEVWSRSDGVVFRAGFSAPGTPRIDDLLFEHHLDTTETPAPIWHDVDLELPDLDGTRELLLETTVGPPGSHNGYDHAGWSAPHIECERAADARQAAGPSARPSIVLVSIDTLRRDRLGVYGAPRDTSPTIDRIARDAVVFDSALTVAPYTLSSHATMFTGLYAEDHRAGFDHSESPLRDDVWTLAERLRDAGYRTVGVSAGGLMTRLLGLARGFEEWHEIQRANLRSTLPIAFDLLLEPEDPADETAPVFLFLHTYDVHGPYQQPEGFRFFRDATSNTSTASARNDADAEWRRILDTHYHRHQNLERFDGIDDVIDAYDSGVRFVDTQIERLVEFLEDTDLIDRTLLVITSDHGESLFDEGRYFGHSYTYDDAELRIPLIVRPPGGLEAQIRRADPVGLVDIAPTLLRVAGVAPPDGLPGLDLLESEAARPERALYGGSPQLGSVFVRTPSWQVSTPAHRFWHGSARRNFGDKAPEFGFQWQIHPVEEFSLLEPGIGPDDDVPAPVRDLAQELRDLEQPGSAMGRLGERDPELEGALRALGYI